MPIALKKSVRRAKIVPARRVVLRVMGMSLQVSAVNVAAERRFPVLCPEGQP
jgi:hypothetical protein